MRRGGGCLEQIIELFMLGALFNWLQERFGFGRGASCGGCGCGIILLIIFLLLACSIITQGAFVFDTGRGMMAMFGLG